MLGDILSFLVLVLARLPIRLYIFALLRLLGLVPISLCVYCLFRFTQGYGGGGRWMRAGDDGTGDYEMIGSTKKGHERAQRGTPTWKTYTACGSRSFPLPSIYPYILDGTRGTHSACKYTHAHTTRSPDKTSMTHSCCAHTAQSPKATRPFPPWFLSSSAKLHPKTREKRHTSTNHLALNPPIPHHRKQKRQRIHNRHRQTQFCPTSAPTPTPNPITERKYSPAFPINKKNHTLPVKFTTSGTAYRGFLSRSATPSAAL